MATKAAVILDQDLRIPAEVFAFGDFRRWSHSQEFPEHGRIDYLDGEVEVDLSPEDLYTHAVVKTAIAAHLHGLITRPGLGNVFVDRTRIVSPAAGLSVEPDIAVVLWRSLQEGRIREVPSARGGEGRFIELEGTPDLLVEIVSDRSVRKDRERLPALYSRAGVPELWLVDGRGADLLFEVLLLGPEGYAGANADAEGWLLSPILGRRVRLTRRRGELSRWTYELEHAPAFGR